VWSHSARLLFAVSSPRRSMPCRCLLGVIVLWTGRKRDVVHHWPCAGSRLPHAQQQQAGNTTDARTATHYHRHPPCDSISYLPPIDKYPAIDGKKVQPIWTACTEARAARVPLRMHASLLHHLSSLHILTIDEPERLRSTLSAMTPWPSLFQQLPVSSWKTIVSP
jgi:hypothetical protein